jgi:aryl sulfotransferase
MSSDHIDLPQKTREIYDHHFDSAIWNDFQFRDDDIIIATYGKSGTTWMQQIVSQLLFDGAEDLPVARMSPWLDLRNPPIEERLKEMEAQTHRRFIKSHLPVDALVFSPKAKYIYIARDGRDVVWSFHNHFLKGSDKLYRAINNDPERCGPPIERPPESVVEYFNTWLERDGYPVWSLWDHVASWWAIRDLPNVMLMHFEDLKADLSGEIRRVAAFLEISIDDSKWDAILEHCSFEYMKTRGRKTVPMGGVLWEGGAKTFIHKGENRRWKDVLPAENSERYEQIAVERLGEECAMWLKNGYSATSS